ncbi:hypothetical protein [Paenibacillus amylolyticus]|uniref:Uncharacterized protein n=1 Tax=Paenibacillus amylolyticus TaxID=1451 RepID=A0ABD8AMH8_PAEAM
MSKRKEFYHKHIQKHVFEELEIPDTPKILENSSEEADSKEELKIPEKKVHRVLTLKSILISFFIIWAASGILIYTFIPKDDRGTFGDMFGAINALFSAFAFGGLVYTLFIQRYELSLQRKELEMQRLEVARNADQLEEQKNVMIQQSFENTFFKMIELHHNILANSLMIETGKDTEVTRLHYFRLGLEGQANLAENEHDLKERVFNEISTPRGEWIKQYINNFYCMLLLTEQFCKNTNINARESDYALIILSQLSDDERVIIFYVLGYELKQRLLLDRFYFLEDLNPGAPEHTKWMRKLYRDYL